MEQPSTPLCLAVIIALAAPLFLIGLGSTALYDPDEPYYAVPAREMLQSGSWQVPLFRGEPWFDKPILFYWIVLAAYKSLGVSELAARLGSALAALGGLLAVFAFGRGMEQGRKGALVSTLVLATTVGYALAARAAVTDMTLTALLAAGMLAAARHLAGGGIRMAWLAGAAFGLGALTKGPVAILIPVVALGAYGLITRRADLARPRALAAAAGGLVLVAAPWYLYMALAYPSLLVKDFLESGNLGRFVHPEHVTFPFYYAVVLAAGLMPWSVALPAALVRAGGRSTRSEERTPGRHPGALFLLCWFGSVVLIFSAAASKLPSYLLPAFPPAALLLGSFWRQELPEETAARPRRPARLTALLGVPLALILAGAAVQTARGHAWDVVVPPTVALGALLVIGSILAALAVARGSLRWLTYTHCATTLAVLIALLGVVMPRLEPFHSTRPLVRELQAAGLNGQVIGTYKVSDVSLDYYLGRNPARHDRMKQVIDAVRKQPGSIWVVRTQDVDSLLAEPRFTAQLIHRGPSRSALRLSTASGFEAENR